jgi:hypothetical protein
MKLGAALPLIRLQVDFGFYAIPTSPQAEFQAKTHFQSAVALASKPSSVRLTPQPNA